MDQDVSPRGSVAPTVLPKASNVQALSPEAPFVPTPPAMDHDSSVSMPEAFPIFSNNQEIEETRSIEASLDTLLENSPGWGGAKIPRSIWY